MPPLSRFLRSTRVVPAAAILVGLGCLTAIPGAAPAARSRPHALAADGCGPITKVYTTDPDFNLGTLNGVVTNTNQLELSATATTWPFAWIANAGEGTISKVNTQTGDEVGRYYTGPPDGGGSYLYLSPSRTVVDKDGNCWVANRTNGAFLPSVSEILVTGGDDRNNNSNIETSTDLNSDGDCADAGEILPWGQDERVKRYYEIGSTQNNPARGMVIDKAGFLWVGLSQTGTLHKLNPNLPIATYAPNQPPSVAPSLATISTGHLPYGLALSPDGMIYQSTLGGWALEIDPGLASGGTAFGPAVTADSIFHDGANYGIAVDKNCIVWLALVASPVAWQGCVRWDPSLTGGNPANGWTISGPGAPGPGRGITVDFNNKIWMSCNDGNNSVVRYNNTPTPTVSAVYPTPSPTPVGVGVASGGNIIVTPNSGSQWCKLNEITGALVSLPGPQLAGYGPYTYSDFTGSLQSVTSSQQGTWNVITDGLSNARIWNFVGWNQGTPPGTSVTVEARAAQTLPLLSAATWITIGTPGPQAPMAGRYIENQVRLVRAVEGCAATFVTPVLYDLTVAGICDTCAFAFCPGDTTVPCEGPLGAVVEFPPPELESDCVGYTVTCTPPSGNFPIGVTPVVCTAVSGSDTVICKFNVTVLPGCDPTPTGACCLATNCIVTTEAGCLQQGGIYFGNGSNCTVGCNYHCIPPPNKMSVWLKLDPPSSGGGGSDTPNQANPKLGGLLVHNPTPLLGEYVDGSYSFNGSTQYVELPSRAGAVGDGDFSIDAWIRTSAASGIQPIVDKRSPPPVQGYGYFLANGYPSVQLAVGGVSSTFSLDGINGGPQAFVADGNWHLVAVSVARGSVDGVRFYVDGSPVGSAFDPTPQAGSLDNTVPLYIARSHPVPVARYFAGPIDEIEIIHDIISPARVAELHSAGVAGKCPELCYATQNVPCCNGVSSTSSFTVCNYDGVSHVYSYGLSTINGGPGCSAVGPTSFTPNTGTVTVPAAGCVTVPLIIGCPTNIPIGQVACYQVSLFNHDTGRLFACRGSVTRPNKWCLKWQLGDPVEVTGIVALDEAHATKMNIKVTNLERTFSGPLDYQIRAFAGHDEDPSTALRLNGLPPGEPVFGTLSVAPGETGTVSLSVEYPKAWLIGYDRIAVYSDNSDGTVDKVGEIAVRGVSTEVVGVPGHEPTDGNPVVTDRLFLAVPNPFGASGLIRFRLPEQADVKLRLYDLIGRSVKIFYMERRLEAGEHGVEWNTVDGRGERLKTGLYLLKLEAGKRSETVKVIVRR